MGIINRWHRTIKEKLTAYFDAFDTVKWIDIIDKIVNNYNNTVNRGIGYKPVDVNDFIENKIRQDKKEEGLKVEYQEFKIGQFFRVLNEIGTYDDKQKSKYSEKIYEITKVRNNSVIFKDDKGNKYQARKNEIKIVVKPDNPIELKMKKQASVDTKQAKTHKNEDIKQENVRQSNRDKTPHNNPNDRYQKKYN
jgi:hypothetical protein